MSLLDRIQVEEKQRQEENRKVLLPIKTWLRKNLDKKKYVFYNNWGGGFNKAGRPDMEVTYKGQTNYWELKDPKGKLSTLQIEAIAAYERAGKTVYVVESLDEFKITWHNIYG